MIGMAINLTLLWDTKVHSQWNSNPFFSLSDKQSWFHSPVSNSNREITWSPSTNIAGFDWLWCNDQSLGLVNCPKLSKNNHISQGGKKIKATCHNSELPLSGITWSHQLCKSLNCKQARRGRNTKRSHCSDAPRRTNLLIAHTKCDMCIIVMHGSTPSAARLAALHLFLHYAPAFM